MITRANSPTAQHDISLQELRDYLNRANWIDVTEPESKVVRYLLGRNRDIGLILPRSSQFLDAGHRIDDALNTLSQVEERDVADLLADIKKLNRDSLQIRIHIPADASSIPLDEAPNQVGGIKNLWLYSACSELKPLKYHDTPITEAMHFVHRCNFGHTFRGSFGFEVSTDVLPTNETSSLFITPFARKITERVARGLNLLQIASLVDDPDQLVDSYETAFNARMCDALIDISLDGEVPFDCRLKWASNTPVSPDIAHFKSVHIGKPQVSILKIASERLKRVEPQLSTVHGFVVNLHCARDPSEDSSKRVIIIRHKHTEHGSIDVRIELDTFPYKQAVDAHTAGLQIEVTGFLHRTGTVWRMFSVSKVFPLSEFR